MKQNFHKHFIGGLFIAFLLNLTYSGIPLLVQFFISAFITAVIATMWEWGWEMYSKAPVDYWDVKWSVIGALVIQLIYTIW
jgi:hypothetical protein